MKSKKEKNLCTSSGERLLHISWNSSRETVPSPFCKNTSSILHRNISNFEIIHPKFYKNIFRLICKIISSILQRDIPNFEMIHPKFCKKISPMICKIISSIIVNNVSPVICKNTSLIMLKNTSSMLKIHIQLPG